MTDADLRRAAAELLLSLRDHRTRVAAERELATAAVVRRDDAVGFVLPALLGRAPLESTLPEHGFLRLVLAASARELDDLLA
ncbi:MAG TPA: hypothetical protein VFG69_16015 [Nannocystaceae bacterium]|nr:hypothetical protein [Nannocystaceae bacterium]